MMSGLACQQWEVYRIGSDSDCEPLEGQLIGIGLTMAESIHDAFAVPFAKIYRRHGIKSGN